MRYLTGLAIIIGTMMISASCIKHEVVPAPEPMVELPASFSAMLDGSSFELIKDVDGYYCLPDQSQQINSAPQKSTITYFSSIGSDNQGEKAFVQIKVGELQFTADASTLPTLDEFNTYFEEMSTVNFSNDASDGVQIIFGDASGNEWYSDEDMTESQAFDFTSIKQDSDENGDYILFTANFHASLVDDVDTPTDTLKIDNAVFKGYFKRQL